MNSFNILIDFEVAHSQEITFPKLGVVTLRRGKKIQLLNAPVEVVEYLRSLRAIGVVFQLNKRDRDCKIVYDYEEYTAEKKHVEENEKPEPVVSSMKERVGQFQVSSGKYAGKKINELDEKTLKRIAKTSSDEQMKNIINTYLTV